MFHPKGLPLRAIVNISIFLAGILVGNWLARGRRTNDKRSTFHKNRASLMFPTNAMDDLKHSQAIKDYIGQTAEWQVSDAKLVAGNERLSEANAGIIKSAGGQLLATINGTADAALLDGIGQKWIAGQIISDEIQPKIVATFGDGISLKADFPPNSTDFDLISGSSIVLTSCSLESNATAGAHRKIFGYLSGLPPAFKARRIAGTHAGVNLFIWATGSKADYCHAVLDDHCTASPAQVAEGIEFALSLFLGTRVHWRTLTVVDENVEQTRLSMAEIEHGLQFPPPIGNTSDLTDDEVADLVHRFLQYHLQKGYSEANYFMHQCWELSPSTQITARALTVAVAIEGISRSVLSSLKKDTDPIFEEIYAQIGEISDSWIGDAKDSDDASARRNVKKRITDLLAKRNELGGKALIQRAFDEAGCLISDEELQIWNKARNATAHGAFKRKSTTQQILDQYYTCVALLYRLILTNMEYHGSFIDYTSKSWPNMTM